MQQRKNKIDITITDKEMLAAIENWETSEEESAPDHNTIKFHIKIEKGEKITNPPGFSFIIKEQQRSTFYEKLYSTISKNSK